MIGAYKVNSQPRERVGIIFEMSSINRAKVAIMAAGTNTTEVSGVTLVAGS